MNNMIDENNSVKFTIRLPNGTKVGNYPSQPLAETAMMSLPEDQRVGATVVPITTDGKEVLLG